MAEKAVLSCRGCLTEVDGRDSYFFVLKKVRDLFTGCTAIEILPEEDECFPQQLCSACYDKCKEWRSFKEMCQEVDKRLQIKAIESVPFQGDEVPTMRIKQEVMDVDESLEIESFIVGEVFKEEEEDQEDELSEEVSFENEDGEKCPVCDVIIPESRPLKGHLKEHYSEENPKCPICDQPFTRSTNIYSHIMSVHKRGDKGEQSERKMEVCPVCEIQTDQLFNHLATVHLEQGQVKCPVCKESFNNLRRHLVTHTGERPFPCGFCDMFYTDKCNRLRHWRNQHKDQEATWNRSEVVVPKHVQVECPKCSKIFPSLSELHRHFVVHTDEQPYICTSCTFTNGYKANVIRHIRQSHPNKSVEDGMSIKEDSIFKSKHPWEAMGYSELTRRHKDAPQPHVCKVCAKGFSSQALLRIHSVVHTKEKPFHCVYCEEGFSYKSNGIAHVRKIHPERPLADAVVLKKSTKYAKEYAKAAKKGR